MTGHRGFLVVALLSVLILAACSAATDGEDRSEIQRELETPREGRFPVTFELSAPEEAEVMVELTANYWNTDPDDTLVLTPDGDRHSITLHLGDGQWLYRFRVDGRWTADPENPHSVPAENGQVNSVLRVGEQPPMSLRREDVPHGELVALDVDSDHVGGTQPLFVHLPPGHDPAETFPLLVLLHGYGQGATEFPQAVEIANYLDNAYADDLIRPMVVAMPEGGTSFFRGAVERHVIDEVLPLLERDYGVVADPDSRVISGSSMGGNGALHLAWYHPDEFGLAVPLQIGGSCTDVVCPVDAVLDQFTGSPDIEVHMLVGATDDLGLVENQANTAEAIEERGVPVTSTVRTYDGHRRDGHSIRFIRAVMPEVLALVEAFFARQD